jgi:ActD protein
MHRLLLAEFDSAEALAEAATALRQRGYRKLDAHTPYSTETVREALQVEDSRLGRRVLAAGLLGAVLAYLLQWYLVAYLYPLDVGGRPPHFPVAFVPIAFEMGILAASVTAFVSVFSLGRLVRLWDPVFEAPGFESASIDGFWLRVDGADPLFDEQRTVAELEPHRPRRQVLLGRGRS